MARTAAVDGLSIQQLHKIIADRKAQVKGLTKQRKKVLKDLAAIDAKIAAAGGSRGSATSTRARNSQSLVEVLLEVLKDGKPARVPDIAAGAQAKGYKSSSASFKGIVNQTLIKEKAFQQVSRGVYQLKK